MKKIEIIKKSYDFEKIINLNKSKKNKYFSIYYQTNADTNKYGISVPRKTGNAVIRNKIKRQVKSIIDNNKLIIPKSFDYVIIIRRGILELNYQNIENELITLFKQIKGEKDE